MDHGSRIRNAATLARSFETGAVVRTADDGHSGTVGGAAATEAFLRHVSLWAAQWTLSCPEFQAAGLAELDADLGALEREGLAAWVEPDPGAGGAIVVRVGAARR